MYSYVNYLHRIFRIPLPKESMQLESDRLYAQLHATLDEQQKTVLQSMRSKELEIREDCCIRSFISGYEVSVHIEH